MLCTADIGYSRVEGLTADDVRWATPPPPAPFVEEVTDQIADELVDAIVKDEDIVEHIA